MYGSILKYEKGIDVKEKKNKLGLFMLIALVTGNMVGSGAFLLPADIARIGSIGLLSLILTILGALCLAQVFAKMSLLIPKTGGPYAYAMVGFGRYIGLQTAYYYWVAVWVGNAAIVVAALGYLNVFYPILNNQFAKFIAIILLIWIPAIINVVGIRFSGFLQIIMAIMKFTPLFIISIFGWKYFHIENITNYFNVTNTTNLSAFSSGIILTLWLFIGVESAAVPTDSVYNPQKNIPLATLIGTIIAALVYLLSYTAIFGMVPNTILMNSTSPFAIATEMIFGSYGKVLVSFGAIVACIGALNGWTLVAAQIPMAAANDNLFPKIFARCNRSGNPVFSIIFTSICITILVITSNYLGLIEQFELLILSATTAELIAYFYTATVEIIVIPKKPEDKYIWQIFVASIAAIYSFFTILASSKEVIFYLMVLLLLTIPVYAVLRCFPANENLK